MGFARHAPVGLAVLAALAIGCNRAEPQLTPEAASAKGDALLREMSKNLAAVQTFAYTADERRERLVRAAQRPREKREREKSSSAGPMGSPSRATGDSGGTAAWYDGKHLTLVSDKAKVWARGPMPATLDEALDFLAANTQCGCRPPICCTAPPTTR